MLVLAKVVASLERVFCAL